MMTPALREQHYRNTLITKANEVYYQYNWTKAEHEEWLAEAKKRGYRIIEVIRYRTESTPFDPQLFGWRTEYQPN